MSIERIRPRFAFDEQRLEQLKQLAPEAVADGKINWETLKEALGEHLEGEETDTEHFGLFWPGKREARRLAGTPPHGTLVPMKGEGVDEDTTRNIFIEGENLEVLKLLQKSYAGRIKMIYIDPPYNTGNDFVYDDNFTETIEDYLKRTGQIDEEGRRLTTNTKADGRFHSKWLSMMYPRLRLARNLLRDDGVIFVSIDDNEVHNLKLLMNEIFGEENFVANIIWQKKFSPQNDAKWFSDMHDHIIVYSKNKELFRPNLLPRTAEMDNRYKNIDNDPRGNWTSSDLTVRRITPKDIYEVLSPSGKKFMPPAGRSWSVSKTKFAELITDNRIWFGESGSNMPRLKRFLNDVKEGITPLTIWLHQDVGHNQEAMKELKELFEFPPFDTPKPTRLLDRIIEISTDGIESEEIILDFFAGSGTTAHSIFKKKYSR